jgi:starch phosphorylase
MVRDYVEQLYEPTAIRADHLNGDGAKALAAWKARVVAGWKGVHIDSVDGHMGAVDLGETRSVSAVVSLGGLSPDDVAVELLHGVVGQNDELSDPVAVTLGLLGPGDDGHLRYEGTFTCDRAGRYGITVRVVPTHPDLATPAELGKVVWA